MNIHEYQAKDILREFGLPLLKGKVAFTSEESVCIARSLRSSSPDGSLQSSSGLESIPSLESSFSSLPPASQGWMIKAQIHAGGRGQGGGVRRAKSLEEVQILSSQILGMNLVTKQTGVEGKKVHKVLIEEACAIGQEYYLAFVLDRDRGGVGGIFSSRGGMDIEEVAAHHPEEVFRFWVDPLVGLGSHQVWEVVSSLRIPPLHRRSFVDLVLRLYGAFLAKDCELLEINPLVLTKGLKEQNLQGHRSPGQGEEWKILDAKMSLDDNALFRHPDFDGLRDITEEDPTETEAKANDLSYIKLDGTIGCLVNGAGLAMATMDIIHLNGEFPANFLDVGGGASPKKITAAFRILFSDPKVKAVLVNIFGGIMKCDWIANGILEAARELNLNFHDRGCPLVVRLEGTHQQEGQRILNESGLFITTVQGLQEAVTRVVDLVRERTGAGEEKKMEKGD